MCFDVQTVTFGDEALAGAREEASAWREVAQKAEAQMERLAQALAAAQAREEAQRQRADGAPSESAALGNAHVRQKDRLLMLSNEGEYERLLDLLDFVDESWRVVGYGYKADEILRRVRGDAKRDLDGLNPRQRKEYARLQAVLARLDRGE